jgi:sigma-B regulation protein RsbU (phosphoserine phosphatase)
METGVLQRIQRSLLDKRQNLTEWLSTTPPTKKQIRLGTADEKAIQDHLMVIDKSLEKAEEQSLGCCEVCCDYVDSELLEMDYTSCVCLEHFSELERRQLEAELEFMQTVQRASLPQIAQAIPGMDLAAFSRPAQIVSGDYFDFFQFKDEAHGLAIADAMGHGVSASMLMTSIQSALRTLAPESNSPAEILERINRLFLHNVNLTTFITAFLAKLDYSTGTFIYCNAGHNPPLLVRQDQDTINWLQPTGAAIGLVEDYKIEAQRLNLSSGDILLLYTDGVTEATNQRQEAFGGDRLAESVKQNSGLSAQEIVQAIRRRLDAFSGEQRLEDDATLVVCKIDRK